jgi:hypothetical protein
MTDRELLIELLAIKYYEHDCMIDKVPAHWTALPPEDRQMYREFVSKAPDGEPEAMYRVDDDE